MRIDPATLWPIAFAGLAAVALLGMLAAYLVGLCHGYARAMKHVAAYGGAIPTRDKP